jgi:hypothetical protein
MSVAVFPSVRGLGWSVFKRPQFVTESQTASNGKELRLQTVQNPIWEIELTYNYLKNIPGDLPDPQNNPYTDLAQIMGFYCSRGGHFDNFLFDDPFDNFASRQLIGLGDAATTKFQLTRNIGGFSEAIQAPRGGVKIWVGGTLKTLTTDYTINSTTGVVTFTVAPAAAARIEAEFSFYFRVTFREDMLEFENFMNQLWTLQSVILVSDPQ